MANNLDINKTLEAWSDILIKNWRHKITILNIGITERLYDSFEFEIISQAQGNPERIDFTFEYYGRFVDMGVGKEVYVGNPGNVKTSRKPKRWYSKVWYNQAQKLSEILSEKYGILGACIIRETIKDEEKRSQKGRKYSLGDASNRHGFMQRDANPIMQNDNYSEIVEIWRQRNGLSII